MSESIPFTPEAPDLRALLLALRMETSATLNCHQVGQIVSFDAVKQTASVQLAVLRTTPDGVLPYPVLTDCPVFMLGGGGGVITFPIIAGDTCLVLFNDRDLDNWFSSGAITPANTPRLHDLSDGLVLVGFRNLSNPIPDFNTTDVEIKFAGGKIQVADKISINNAATSLKTVFDQLITALTSWVDTHGDTPNPTTIAALNAVKTLADSLFK